MSWRALLGMIVLALLAGAGGFAWLTSNGAMGTLNEKPAVPLIDDGVPAASADFAAPAFASPIILQQDAGQAETKLLLMQVRRAIESGRPLRDLGGSLQARFGQTQPQLLAVVANGARQPISNVALLASFDAISAELVLPDGTAWDRIELELNGLFVIRSGPVAQTASQAAIATIRKHIIAGEIDEASAKIRKLPGAVKAGDWIVTANQAIAVHRALDQLAQSVMQLPVAVPPPAAVTPAAPTHVQGKGANTPLNPADGE